jgi:hypothetical protein
MPVLEQSELVEDIRSACTNAGKFHELGKTDDLGMTAKRPQVFREAVEDIAAWLKGAPIRTLVPKT